MQGTHLFGQMLGILPRSTFDLLVQEYAGNKGSKGIGCWDILTTMLFAQLSGTDSLREIAQGMSAHHSKLGQLGQAWLPKPSSLSYAIAHRPWEIFAKLYEELIPIALRECGTSKRAIAGLRNPVFSIDSTTIDLALSLFSWAKFRANKGAIKLHTVLDNATSLPVFVQVTNGKVHDVRGLREEILPEFQFPPESVIVMDRGYSDYNLWQRWNKEQIWFVTRLKDGSNWEITQTFTPAQGPGPHKKGQSEIRHDCEIQLTSEKGKNSCPFPLRRVVVWDPVSNREIILVSNNLKFSARQIADLYKDRWQVELFFKKIKQNLKITSFIGTSTNAVKIQVYTALCAVLLVEILRARSRKQRQIRWEVENANLSRTAPLKPKGSLAYSNFVALIRLNLFIYRDLKEWLINPFSPPTQREMPESDDSFFGQQLSDIGVLIS
jgi:Transposase DDE domain/Domain of unknown function (DUF4372)